MFIQLIRKGPVTDVAGRPIFTATDESNPWWSVFEQAITSAGGKLSKPEILSSTTDSRFVRQLGIPALGFSPMSNTPILLHDNDEVSDPGLILFSLSRMWCSKSILSQCFSFWRIKYSWGASKCTNMLLEHWAPSRADSEKDTFVHRVCIVEFPSHSVKAGGRALTSRFVIIAVSNIPKETHWSNQICLRCWFEWQSSILIHAYTGYGVMTWM